MELCGIAFAVVICLFVSVEGQTCECASGCGSTGITSTLPNKVNIAYGRETNMSEIYKYISEEAGPACLAVDGKTSTTYVGRPAGSIGPPNPTFAYNCIHSQHFDYDPWWQVDLGRLFTVTNITIYRRKGAERRMAGLSVLVDDKVCYSFPNSSDTAALDGLEEMINVTCSHPLTGRVVRLQKHGQDTEYQFYFINICEVQVWACKDGLYGAQCDQTCSGHCTDNVTCDNYNGTCHEGCNTGHRGGDCRCGYCEDGADCDVTTQICPDECDKGWDTHFCNQSCPAGTHGYYCSEQCGQCAYSDTCNTVTGLCPRGCQRGWQGDNCKQKCADGYYGQRCMSRCGQCSDGEVCDKVNGACPTGCQPGFDPSDRLCKILCQSMHYGAECAHRCGQCQNNALCDVVTGHCDVCLPNLLHPLCQVCEGKMYGAQCETQCSAQCGGDGSCHRNNGTCQAGCASGYLLGSGLCEEKCLSGAFGPGCGKTCGNCAKSRCNHRNGTCELGCIDGYIGDLCSELSETESSPNLAGPVAGGVFGGLCVLALSILIVGLLIRRSRKRSSSNTASGNQRFEPGAPVELNGQESLPEETGSAGVTEAEQSNIYDGLQTPEDSDRAPYSTPVFKGQQDNARNSHTYQNSGLHTSGTGHDYYNMSSL